METSISHELLEKFLHLVHRLIEFVGCWIFVLCANLRGSERKTVPGLKSDDVIITHSAGELARLIRLRKLKVEDVVQAYVDRIRVIQPVVNCVTEDRFEEALEEARGCDTLLSSASCPSSQVLEKEKPFFGVPFTTKDCLRVSGMRQTAGLVTRRNVRATSDATAVGLLREAGGIVLATTNVSELAMWWESSNYLYGTTNNPYNTSRTVGGSSGGEGCIQAAAGSAMGLGSDIGGSIRMPCFFNGVFGHKPTTGIVSNDGQYPTTQTPEHERLLSIGPMCRHATDLTPMLRVIAGRNADKLRLGAKVDLSQLNIFFMEDDGGQIGVSAVTDDVRGALRRAVHYLEVTHGLKARRMSMPRFKSSLPLWIANMTSPEGRDFAYQLANQTGRINIFLEFGKWLIRRGDHTLVSLFTACLQAYGIQHSSEERRRLVEESEDFRRDFAKSLGENGVLLYPTHPTAAPHHNEPLLKPFNFSYTAVFNVLGNPATACPLGLGSEGLPVGIQVVAGLYQDHVTLAVAEELERGLGGWTKPTAN